MTETEKTITWQTEKSKEWLKEIENTMSCQCSKCGKFFAGIPGIHTKCERCNQSHELKGGEA